MMRTSTLARCLVPLLSLCLLQASFGFASKESKDKVSVRAFVNDTCIVADEPFFLPVAPPKDGDEQANAKFLPLIGLIVGKLAELFINHEIQSSANRYKAGNVRKDTRYAMSSQMNLYRADLSPTPALSINARLGCMTIVAGAFKPDSDDCTTAYIPKELAHDSIGKPQEEWKTSRTDDSIENQLRRANICVDGRAKAVYEARFEFSKDGTAYRLHNAGYRVDALLTTDKKGAVRTTIYTLKISNPAATDQQEVLSSAWVNIGNLSAGARSNNGESANAKAVDPDTIPWLRVPPLSVEARRIYEDKTKVHQDVTGQIEALQRAQVRNQRVLSGLDRRIQTASPDLQAGLAQERTRIAVQNQSQAAELEALRAEYQDLPQSPLEFMPVSIEVAVTETESEKKAQVALAEIVGSNSDLVASAVGTAATGLLSKSLSNSDLKEDPSGDFADARAQYYDALMEAKSGGHAAELEAAKTRYNTVRHSLGLEQIQ